ncbi:P-loop containing nucleoside triphosphate hydrolase protein [Spinellus fusiger]|nr:P-loop containing nucleoside triphosphate hydrolase protein [Spinellus fusiger]
MDEQLARREHIIETTMNEIKEEKKKSAELESNILAEEDLRRKLHNDLQECKGNIRVFCRVRPAMESEKRNLNSITDMKFCGEDNDTIEITEKSKSTLGRVSSKRHSFSFDQVFPPENTQKECYEEISHLVQSALDGHNICIFAYGQTGSGKTYTMEGTPGENRGVIPRAVHQLYNLVQKLKEHNWHYEMVGQFLEIYNESIRDLLGDNSEHGKTKYEIRHEKSGKTEVTGMTSIFLDSPARVHAMLKKASHNRATAATNINERSSRSHSVFILRIQGQNSATGETTEGLLNLVDLAGSERLSMSGSTGDRLRETQAINRSLSCLGDVIASLAENKDVHVPYRNSKLTYLLKNSLGGDSKTLMFVNVSPLADHFNETLCSLRFAKKVNNCKVGKARKYPPRK